MCVVCAVQCALCVLCRSVEEAVQCGVCVQYSVGCMCSTVWVVCAIQCGFGFSSTVCVVCAVQCGLCVQYSVGCVCCADQLRKQYSMGCVCSTVWFCFWF